MGDGSGGESSRRTGRQRVAKSFGDEFDEVRKGGSVVPTCERTHRELGYLWFFTGLGVRENGFPREKHHFCVDEAAPCLPLFVRRL